MRSSNKLGQLGQLGQFGTVIWGYRLAHARMVRKPGIDVPTVPTVPTIRGLSEGWS